MRSLASTALRGSFPPLITPFDETGAVDCETFAKLVEFQIREGSHGIVVAGTTAEPSLLTLDERKELLETAIRISRKRVPVMAATGSQSFAETLDLSVHAEQAGADALLVVTPYYVRPPQRGLVEYFAALARQTSLPILIYHIPGRAGVTITIETLAAIIDAAPSVVGMKHASADLELVTDAIARFGEDFRIFVGLEELSFPMLALGACGMINAVSNIAPGRIVELYDAVAAGDMIEARRLHLALVALNRAVFYDTNPIPIKYMAKRLGIIPRNHHRLPMMPATGELEARLDALMERSGLLNDQVVALG